MCLTGHVAPIEKEIRDLSHALEAVKDEQEYIVTRERIHRDSAFLSYALSYDKIVDMVVY